MGQHSSSFEEKNGSELRVPYVKETVRYSRDGWSTVAPYLSEHRGLQTGLDVWWVSPRTPGAARWGGAAASPLVQHPGSKYNPRYCRSAAELFDRAASQPLAAAISSLSSVNFDTRANSTKLLQQNSNASSKNIK